MLDEELEKKARDLQTALMNTTHTNWSFSKILNLLIEQGLEKFPDKSN